MSLDGSENGAENDAEISVEDITENGEKVKTEQSPISSPSDTLLGSHAQSGTHVDISSRFNPSTMTAQVHYKLEIL